MPKQIVSATSGPRPAVVMVEKPIASVQDSVEAVVPRDRWDRPLIIPIHGGEPVAYTRVSTLAETLDDKTGLHNWKLQRVVAGLSRRADLSLSAQLLDPDREGDKRTLGVIAEQALEVAGTSVASNNGTTLHALTDALDRGRKIPAVLPPHITAMLDAYQRVMERFRVVDSERFIVNDRVKAAGTYDRRLYDEKTEEHYVGDLKTGKRIDYLGMKTCVQVATYEDGKHYEMDGEREEFESSHEHGLLIWLPWTENPADAHCEARWLPLRKGRRAIKVALAARELRAMGQKEWLPPVR